MDELEISGKRYISAKRAGRENKYHPDYIGQLIRANKVVGQKVGRSWYIDAESLDSYLKGEMAVVPKVIVKEIPKIEMVVAPMQPVRVVEQAAEPVASVHVVQEYIPASMRPRTLAPVAPIVVAPMPVEMRSEVQEVEQSVAVKISTPEVKRGGLTYISDESSLLPEISKESEHFIPVSRVEEAPVREQYIPRNIAPMVRPRKTKSVLGLATLGVATFLIIAGVSYALNYTAVIEGEKATASVSLGL